MTKKARANAIIMRLESSAHDEQVQVIYSKAHSISILAQDGNGVAYMTPVDAVRLARALMEQALCAAEDLQDELSKGADHA